MNTIGSEIIRLRISGLLTLPGVAFKIPDLARGPVFGVVSPFSSFPSLPGAGLPQGSVDFQTLLCRSHRTRRWVTAGERPRTGTTQVTKWKIPRIL